MLTTVCGAARPAQPGSQQHPQRRSASGAGDPYWVDRSGGVKAASGNLLSGVAVERRRLGESALVSMVAASYQAGVSYSPEEEDGRPARASPWLSRSQVSEMAKDIDDQLRRFGPGARRRALHLPRRRRAGRAGPRGRPDRVCTIAWTVATPNYRTLGLHLISAEDGAGWLAFFRDLVVCGLSGVALVTSDAAPGTGRGHRRHPARRLVSKMSRPLRGEPDYNITQERLGWVQARLHSHVYDQPGAEELHAQFHRLHALWPTELPAVAQYHDAAHADIHAFTAFTTAAWRQIWSDNPAPRRGGEV